MKNLISILFSIIGFQSLSSQALVTSIDNDTIIIGNNVKYIIKLENDKEERAHAIAIFEHKRFKKDDIIVLNLSGRGDKDLENYIKYFGIK